MICFSEFQINLLNFLADGQSHSGNEIGEYLGISRTAVWKIINQLSILGLEIKRIPQIGYQLIKPLIPLNEQRIRLQLEKLNFSKGLHFHLFAEINSTNQYLKELESKNLIEICCAEKQTHGRGRFGRQWVSPFGENIYFSSRWEFNCCFSNLSGLSLVVALAILVSLKASKIDENIQIKWPNDLIWENQKLAGILIEIIAETNGCAQVIIGIGINVNMGKQNLAPIDKPWCSLYEIKGVYFDRNLLIAHLIYQLNDYIDQFLENGFSAFAEEWKESDYLHGHMISVFQPTGSLSGEACGVNDLGQLCLRDDQSKIHYLSSGDTSFRFNF